MNDDRLARLAAAGDASAFAAIFRRYHQDLYRYCLATVGDPQDAQDALQSTMVKAMQALPGERREIKLKPWLYRVARNEAIETVRRRREGVELDAERESAGPQVAESAEGRERLRQLLADLEALPERQRSALVMRELGGLDFAEIAASFGTSPAVARQTVYEARLSLRQMGKGREMGCEAVMKALSDADGRVARRRDLRAHLRTCANCRAFRGEIGERRGELAAIAPLPAALSAGLLQALAGGKAGAAAASGAGAGAAGAGSGAGAGATAGAGAGAAAGAGAGASGGVGAAVGSGLAKAAAGATIAKYAATVGVVAAVGVGAADRGGVIDLPLGGGDKPALREPQRGLAPALETARRLLRERDPAGARRAEAATRASSAGLQNERSEAVPPPRAPGTAAAANRRGGSAAAPAARDKPKPVSPGSPPTTSSRGKPQGASGRGEENGRSAGPQDPPPAAGRGQETATGRNPPQAHAPPAGATLPPKPPMPEQPPQSDGAPVVPATPAPEASKPGPGSKGPTKAD